MSQTRATSVLILATPYLTTLNRPRKVVGEKKTPAYLTDLGAKTKTGKTKSSYLTECGKDKGVSRIGKRGAEKGRFQRRWPVATVV